MAIYGYIYIYLGRMMIMIKNVDETPEIGQSQAVTRRLRQLLPAVASGMTKFRQLLPCD
jgi:hypothetical protein